MCQSSERAHDRCTGSSINCLAIIWGRPSSFSARTSGLKLVNGECVYLLLNIFALSKNGNTEGVTNYKLLMAELSSICTNEIFTDVIIVSNFNSDPNKGRFYTELNNLTNALEYIVSDVDRLPPDSYTYLRANPSAGSSRIDHAVISRSKLVSSHKTIIFWL